MPSDNSPLATRRLALKAAARVAHTTTLSLSRSAGERSASPGRFAGVGKVAVFFNRFRSARELVAHTGAAYAAHRKRMMIGHHRVVRHTVLVMHHLVDSRSRYRVPRLENILGHLVHLTAPGNREPEA